MNPKETENQLLSLEKNMLRYQDLVNVETQENGDVFIPVSRNDLPWAYQAGMSDMEKQLGADLLIVRSQIYEKLLRAQQKLQITFPDYSLFLTYGYRSQEIQLAKFQQQLSRIASERYFANPTDLYEEVHRFIAVPEVAGHPTGGAVDVLIFDKNTEKLLDFGTPIYDFEGKKCYTFYPLLTDVQRRNRLLLRRVMTEAEGFAPFDGEYWHFSWGDKEWAYYYKKPFAFYTQIPLSMILNRKD